MPNCVNGPQKGKGAQGVSHSTDVYLKSLGSHLTPLWLIELAVVLVLREPSQCILLDVPGQKGMQWHE